MIEMRKEAGAGERDLSLSAAPFSLTRAGGETGRCTESGLLLGVHSLLLPPTQQQLALLNKTSAMMPENHFRYFFEIKNKTFVLLNINRHSKFTRQGKKRIA